MLFLHEVHQVAGRREEEFEAAYRDGWMPSLAKGDDARLLYFLHHAHGTGRAYNVVTITAIRDGAAWEQLMLRLHDGDLRRGRADVDQLRHEVAAKMLVPVPWSPLKDLDLAAVPTSGHHALTLFMEDTAWPYEGGLDEYLEAARTNYAPEPRRGRAHGTVAPGAPGRVPSCVGRRALARGRAVAEGHAAQRRDAPRDDRGPARVPRAGHVDARRPRGARRLGEQAAPHHRLVARSSDATKPAPGAGSVHTNALVALSCSPSPSSRRSPSLAPP